MLLALLLYLGVECWMRWKRLTPTPQDRLALAAVALFATLLHLAMDALNSYGVHPFWPVENRWYYGDSVFIVEPLYWAAAAPLFFVVRSTAARIVVALAPVAAIVVGAASHVVLPAWCVGFAILTVIMLIVGARTSARTAALTSAAFMVFVTGMFIVAGQAAGRSIDALANTDFPQDRLIDRILTPMPLNPVCWDVLLLETHGDRYAIRHGTFSNAAGLIRAQGCPTMAAGSGTTAPLVRVLAPDSGTIHWLGEFAMSRSVLASLVAAHCDAAQIMQFARAPFATEQLSRWVIGDFRFDRGPRLGMAKFVLDPPSAGPCRRSVPWTPPRQDLLD